MTNPCRPAKLIRIFALFVLTLSAAPALGQDEYVIGGGDVLQINVWKNTELSQTVTVRPDGYITLPLVRDVMAGGMTAMQLGKVVAEKLSAFVNAPNVTITVSTANNYRVYTQGAIATGIYALQAPTTARQLLSRAGGPTPEADLSRAYILRREAKIPVDLSTTAGGPNPALQSGDLLVVPPREVTFGRVLVVGEVARPQAIPYQEGMTFLDAYLGAGGGTTSAELKNAKIARQKPGGEPVEIPVDLDEILKKGALGRNITLMPGDIIIVPFRPEVERILVVGEVRTPRTLSFKEGMTVLDAFVEAGGGTEFADLGAVKVVRRLADGKRTEMAADLGKVMKKADLTRNVILAPGDIVVVPR